MDKFAAMEVFTQVVSAGGFSAAARRMGLSRSAVSKHIAELESDIGVQLLFRTTRKMTPTEAGLAYFERCRAILDDVAETEAAISDTDQRPRGLLRVNAPMSFGILHLGPAVADFMLAHPQLQVQMNLDDRFVDPVAEGFDVTIRIAELDDSSLIARRIVAARMAVSAAPAYLAAHGTPLVPDDLRDHDCLHYGNLPSSTHWRLTGPGGAHRVPIRARMCTNNGQVLRDGAVAGLGICALPTFIVGPELQAGRLATVLPDYTFGESTVHALYAPSRYLAAKVRLFIDFLVDRFGDRPSWDLVE
ncbi:MAG: LysR family transcriptional regulator [Alphaproteobacteria bacterium]|nr:LysR family transcriptional regulator [Alphaproteobacteria bacterium]